MKGGKSGGFEKLITGEEGGTRQKKHERLKERKKKRKKERKEDRKKEEKRKARKENRRAASGQVSINSFQKEGQIKCFRPAEVFISQRAQKKKKKKKRKKIGEGMRERGRERERERHRERKYINPTK